MSYRRTAQILLRALSGRGHCLQNQLWDVVAGTGDRPITADCDRGSQGFGEGVSPLLSAGKPNGGGAGRVPEAEAKEGGSQERNVDGR